MVLHLCYLVDRLKDDAVPSIFPNAPSYVTVNLEKRRTTSKSTSAYRRDQETKQLQQLEQSFTDSDNISTLSLSEMADKLQNERIPSGFIVNLVDESLLIYVLDTKTDIIKVSASIRVSHDFAVIVTPNDKVVPRSQYSDLLNDNLKQLSQLVNLMARLKSWLTDSEMRTLSFKLETAIMMLEECLELLDKDSDDYIKLAFQVEQLRLARKQKFARHYSPQLTVLAYMVNASSPATYRVLREENNLCLPSVSTLKKSADDLVVTAALTTQPIIKCGCPN